MATSGNQVGQLFSPEDIHGLCSEVKVENLKNYLEAIEGVRHAWENYDALEKKAQFIEDILHSFHLKVENQYVPFYGRTYRNIIATKKGAGSESWILLGAHYDAPSQSQGADDNASGVAVLLETARILSSVSLNRTIQFVAFTLEEPQPQTLNFLIGSSHFVKEAKKLKRKYEAALILECVGYTNNTEGSQNLPVFVRKDVPRKGNFLAIVSNRKSKKIMDRFHAMAIQYAPELITVPYQVPLSGYVIPESRFSDHASFWNHGYPALMLTDTAMFRNPYYHTARDITETLDFTFMSNVCKAVVATLAGFNQ